MFITPAFAQAAGGSAPGGILGGSLLIPMVLVFGIMWFFMIRPQQKKAKEDDAMRKALRRGDQVLTQGGLLGKVTKVKDEGEIEVEIASGVKARFTRNAVVQVISKTEPAEG